LLQYYCSRQEGWNEDNKKKDYYFDRFNEEMQFAESQVDLFELHTFYEENQDEKGFISFDQALHWAQSNKVPGDIPYFLYMNGRRCDEDGTWKFGRYDFKAAIVHAERVDCQKACFKGDQEEAGNQPISSKAALAKLRDLAPDWSEERLLELVLEKSTMQWKSLTDKDFAAMVCPEEVFSRFPQN
jgi:hypothetical protein